MIATDITGGPAGNGDAAQVFNLLAVVANPDAYGAKLKALVEATEENKKFVALVGPADQVLSLREEAATDRAAAARELAEAKADSARTKADNKKLAKAAADKAKQELADAQARVAELVGGAEAQLNAAEVQRKGLEEQSDALRMLQSDIKAELMSLTQARAVAEAEKLAAQAERATLRAKAEDFIKGL